MSKIKSLITKKGIHPNVLNYPEPNYESIVEDDVLIERNVKVVLRDGVGIYVDIYRPVNQTDVPVLISWAPYGKTPLISWERDFPGCDVNSEGFSKYTPFEAPDPIYWASNGYAVIFPDPRGLFHSEGDPATFFGEQEAEDEYDLIEWAGTQDWSNGKVGLSGVSYLAWSQWKVAALNPPHLAAINPWEGVTDYYRELVFHGGIRNTQFMNMLQGVIGCSLTNVEDLETMAEENLMLNDYWKSKNADLSKITVPAYVVASWSDHALHTRGTLEGFKKISSEQKWLEVHGRKKWNYYYDPESVKRQKAFFDHFLKGEETEINNWPKVNLEIRDSIGKFKMRKENEWPIERTKYTPLYLDAKSSKLLDNNVQTESRTFYESEIETDCATFDYLFNQPTEIIGHSKLRLWVSSEQVDDMDMFVAIQKLDTNGQIVNYPYFATFEDGQVALGWLRASHRELDEEKSTIYQPVHKHEKQLPLPTDGTPVPVEIEIWPSSTIFNPGETLRIVIQGTDINKYKEGLFAPGHKDLVNKGKHFIHTGGKYDSHLLLPIIPKSK